VEICYWLIVRTYTLHISMYIHLLSA